MCDFWNKLKIRLDENYVLYTTSNNCSYKFHSFKKNRKKEDVLKFSIPKRNAKGFNYKSIPQSVICKANTERKKGIVISKLWMKDNFSNLYIEGDCRFKVLQSIVNIDLHT
jgi:hypothetical protein